MIRVERDPEFWLEVASHPAVSATLMGGDPSSVGLICQIPAVLPLASDNGGFFFAQLDVMGLVRELHTLFRPEGWGREVTAAAKEAFELVFTVAQTVVTYEVEGNKRSQPPRSFGFVQAGDWREVSAANGDTASVRSWVLTKLAWEASPAHRRMMCQ